MLNVAHLHFPDLDLAQLDILYKQLFQSIKSSDGPVSISAYVTQRASHLKDSKVSDIAIPSSIRY
jgi:hypothetical protein